MQESKIELTRRLEREGRYSEAMRYKDQKIAELRDAGMSRKEAGKAGWEAMAAEYPPSPVEDCAPASKLPAATSAELDALPSGSSPRQFVNDVFWVYGRLGASDLKPEDAPSPGAWSLMRYARQNEQDFLRHILPKALQLQAKYSEQEEIDEMERAEEQRIDDLEAEMEKLKWKHDPVSAAAEESYRVVESAASSGRLDEATRTLARSIVERVEKSQAGSQYA